jgi:hypothetical protein
MLGHPAAEPRVSRLFNQIDPAGAVVAISTGSLAALHPKFEVVKFVHKHSDRLHMTSPSV